jgi:hypothetical protein
MAEDGGRSCVVLWKLVGRLVVLVFEGLLFFRYLRSGTCVRNAASIIDTCILHCICIECEPFRDVFSILDHLPILRLDFESEESNH